VQTEKADAATDIDDDFTADPRLQDFRDRGRDLVVDDRQVGCRVDPVARGVSIRSNRSSITRQFDELYA
jgi:hypothetical protein